MTPRFLDLVEVLEIHQTRIDLYGGKSGVRDLGLLLHMRKTRFVYCYL
jgi:hypothetical protein